MGDYSTGDRIRMLREVLDFSQKDISEIMGVSLSTVERWEDDYSMPNALNLSVLAGVLNTTEDFLLCKINKPAPAILPDNIFLMTILMVVRDGENLMDSLNA